MQRQTINGARLVRLCSVLALAVPATLHGNRAEAQCHPANSEDIPKREDIAQLPDPLKKQLVDLAKRPHTYPPIQVFAEADPETAATFRAMLRPPTCE